MMTYLCIQENLVTVYNSLKTDTSAFCKVFGFSFAIIFTGLLVFFFGSVTLYLPAGGGVCSGIHTERTHKNLHVQICVHIFVYYSSFIEVH